MANKLGERIRDRMKYRGVSQEQLADMVGVGQPQISRLLRGERGTDIETVKNIATALGESQREYVLLLANLPIDKHEARIFRVEEYLEGMSEQEQEMAERLIESIRPNKTMKSSKKQGT